MNDWADRNFDAHVERTRTAPSPRADPPREALALAALLALPRRRWWSSTLNVLTLELAVIAFGWP